MSKLKKALEKAKEARGNPPAGLPRANEAPLGGESSAIGNTDSGIDHRPFKPIYVETATVKCDAELLRKNRVISVCTEDEADRLKILRTQILNRMNEQDKTTLLVTSANPGEGKTLTALNLAISFSHQFNKTVLLVDANIRNPSTHRYLGLEDGPGLSDYLTGKASIADGLVNPGMERIVIFRAGTPRTNSAELIGSPRMKALLNEMKGKYPDRFIIFDSAPVLKSADPLVFANLVDGILLVVEAEKTRKEDLVKVMDMLKGKPLLGSVLTKVLE